MKNFVLLLISCSLMVCSCKFVEKIKDGTTAFERKQYAVATKMLAKEYNKSKSRVEQGKLAFMIGESYTKMNESKNAIEWYKIAFDNQFGIDALKQYAYALKKNQQYSEAKKAFKELGFEIGSPYEYRKEIAACEVAEGWLKENDRTGFTIELENFSSSFSDYAPAGFMADKLVFTSDRGPADDKTGSYKWTGNAFTDLFIVDLSSGQVEKFNPMINTEHNEGTACFNNNFTEIIFTRCSGKGNEDYYCKLMISRKESESWSVPVKLDFTEEKTNYGHPTLSGDGQTLYFSANHADGWGGYDIYYAKRKGDFFPEAKLLSRSINTIYDEKFPFIDQDTLYFASSGHTGMGGLDIFRSYKMNDDRWAPVQNLKAPINSGADDFGYITDYRLTREEGVLQAGFFCSSREKGKGNDDIYKFEKRKPLPPPPPPVDTTITIPPEPVEIVYKMLLDVYVLEKIYERKDDPDSRVLGRKPLPQSRIQVNSGNEKKEFTIGEDGKITIELEENSDYNFFGSKKEYLNNTGFFSTKGIGNDPANPSQTFELEIILDKIFKDKEIVLDDIYYDFDKFNIRADAQRPLNKLADILRQNPEIKIRLASHTDCRGNNSYNQKLSQNRAQSALDYLVANGIQRERLSAVGYGESLSRADCSCSNCSEEEHQLNRRTTFTIIEI